MSALILYTSSLQNVSKEIVWLNMSWISSIHSFTFGDMCLSQQPHCPANYHDKASFIQFRPVQSHEHKLKDDMWVFSQRSHKKEENTGSSPSKKEVRHSNLILSQSLIDPWMETQHTSTLLQEFISLSGSHHNDRINFGFNIVAFYSFLWLEVWVAPGIFDPWECCGLCDEAMQWQGWSLGILSSFWQALLQ